MNDNQLIQIFLPIIKNGLIAMGLTGVVVKQFNQPTQQGINTGPTVYFSKIPGDRRLGNISYTGAVVDDVYIEISSQWYESTFSVSALVIQDPTNISLYTASDLVNSVAAIMQSQLTTELLAAQGIGIYRVNEVPNPFFKDDRDQFEASSNFNFTLTHQQIITVIPPIVDSVNPGIYPV